MLSETTGRPMTLRQLLIHVEKCARDLASQLDATVQPRLADFRELSRPLRHRSHYPTFLALRNALEKVQQAGVETGVLAEYLEKVMRLIQERVRAEKFHI